MTLSFLNQSPHPGLVFLTSIPRVPFGHQWLPADLPPGLKKQQTCFCRLFAPSALLAANLLLNELAGIQNTIRVHRTFHR